MSPDTLRSPAELDPHDNVVDHAKNFSDAKSVHDVNMAIESLERDLAAHPERYTQDEKNNVFSDDHLLRYTNVLTAMDELSISQKIDGGRSLEKYISDQISKIFPAEYGLRDNAIRVLIDSKKKQQEELFKTAPKTISGETGYERKVSTSRVNEFLTKQLLRDQISFSIKNSSIPMSEVILELKKYAALGELDQQSIIFRESENRAFSTENILGSIQEIESTVATLKYMDPGKDQSQNLLLQRYVFSLPTQLQERAKEYIQSLFQAT